MSAGRSALGGRAGAAAGTRPHSAAAPRLTCSGRAEEDGPAPPPPAPPCPRTQAFSAVYGEAMGRLPGAAATAPLGCLRRGGRSLNHTLGGRGGGGGGGGNHNSEQIFAARNLKRGTFPAPAPAEKQRLPVPVPAPPSLPFSLPARLHAPGSPSSGGSTPGRCGDSARPRPRAVSGQRGQGRSSGLEFSSPRAKRLGGSFGLGPSPFQPPGRRAKSLQVGRAGRGARGQGRRSAPAVGSSARRQTVPLGDQS